jgi:dUTPase
MEAKIIELHTETHISALTPGSNRLCLHARLDGPVLLAPGARKLIPTGIAIALPTSTEAHIRPRRDLAVECGVTILDAPCIVSSGDLSEIEVLLINLGEKGVSIKPGMAIADMSIISAIPVTLQTAEHSISHRAPHLDSDLGLDLKLEVMSLG